MKNVIIMCITALFLVACSNKEKLDRETALKLIEGGNTYPKVISYNIFVSDPAYAQRVLDAGLEELGLVVVQRARKLTDIGQPIISFTKKAEPYLLPQSDEDKTDGVQRVKIAEEVLEEVTGVQIDGENKAIAKIKTSFMNVSPFSSLSKLELKTEKVDKVNFELYDDGWRIN